MRKRDSRRVREALWALVLASLLSAGALAVLLLNTSMQQQAIQVSHQQKQVALLEAQTQAVQASLERTSDPSLLARRARTLHMHPATTSKWATPRKSSATRRHKAKH